MPHELFAAPFRAKHALDAFLVNTRISNSWQTEQLVMPPIRRLVSMVFSSSTPPSRSVLLFLVFLMGSRKENALHFFSVSEFNIVLTGKLNMICKHDQRLISERDKARFDCSSVDR